ncbi:hypothetical protein CGCF415_v012311 [Colletotrichum fructicola]|nr:hypothetical protein CGCFRS4_v010673 [Colletotrichum fructicola]KAF4894302.1 hypothetical protein CGCF415_v012311 [Colletotrichum fructicola]KAF4939769.1 hypothetical protein CGCF245_v003291 [Colletotrichum fructicola]
MESNDAKALQPTGFRDDNIDQMIGRNTARFEDEQETLQHIEENLATDEDEQGKPRIGYRIEYRNRWSNDLLSERIHDGDDQSDIDQSYGPIFEVVTSYKVMARGTETHTGVAVKSLSLPTYTIRIYSLALMNSIQSVVRYYPGQDLSGEYITIPWPYPVLVHHYDELHQFRNDCLSKSQDELCIRERDAAEHLGILLEYLEQQVMEQVREEKERNRRGFATFDWRWVANKPGVTILSKLSQDTDWTAYVVHSVAGGILDNPPSPWVIKTWRLDFDGQFVHRVWNFEAKWLKFDGERREADQASEIRYLDPTSNDQYRNDEVALELIRSGERFVEMLKPKCYQHNKKSAASGRLLTSHGHSPTLSSQIDSLVMVDFKAFHADYPNHVPQPMNQDDLRNWVSECSCDVCRRRKQGEN